MEVPSVCLVHDKLTINTYYLLSLLKLSQISRAVKITSPTFLTSLFKIKRP